MKTLVIYGGHGLSEEAEISMRSGKAVVEAAKAAGIDAEGFELNENNIDELKQKLPKFDVAFPALHGKFGEDGQIQKLCDSAEVKYVGSGADASRRCWDKASYKMEIGAQAIATPEWRIVESEEGIEALSAPVVIKPIYGGASIDMIVARKPEELDLGKAKEFLAKHGQLLAEEYIEGQEIAVGILGQEPLPVIEIIPPAGKWFDLESKYSAETIENVPPQKVSADLQKRAQTIARDIHELIGCKDLSRTDMIIKGDVIYVLETNTMPGLTPQSLYPKEAEAADYPMPKLIKHLIDLATKG